MVQLRAEQQGMIRAMRGFSFSKNKQRICLPVVACDVVGSHRFRIQGAQRNAVAHPFTIPLDCMFMIQGVQRNAAKRPALSAHSACGVLAEALAGALARDAAPGDNPIGVNVAVVCEAYHRADGKRSDRDSGGIALRVRSGRNRDWTANVHAPEADIEPCCWQIAVHLRLAMGPVGGNPHSEPAGTERPSHRRHSGTKKARAD